MSRDITNQSTNHPTNPYSRSEVTIFLSFLLLSLLFLLVVLLFFFCLSLSSHTSLITIVVFQLKQQQQQQQPKAQFDRLVCHITDQYQSELVSMTK